MNDLTQTQNTEAHKWFKVVLFAGMLLFAFYASTHMVAAGDTWVAMACGRHFTNHGVDTVEPFSFNSHHAGPTEEDIAKWPGWTQALCKPFSLKTIQKWHPTGWINQNWLTHLIFYKLASWFGEDGSYNYNTLVYWKFVIYILTVFCVYAVGKNLGAGDFLSAAAACMAMVVGRTFFDIRPAGYSNLLVPTYILILVLTTYRNYRLIWLLIPLVVFWANVHGGYLFAFIMLIPFVGIHLLLRLPRRWSICLGFVGLWLVLYLMSHKFISGYASMIEQYYWQLQSAYNLGSDEVVRNIELMSQKVFGYDPATVSLVYNKMFFIWGILAIISLVLTSFRNIKSGVFYFYHILAGIIFFLSLVFRFFVGAPKNLPAYFSSHITSAVLSFVFICILGALLVLAMALKKDRFIALPLKGIYHTMTAGIVAFIAMIVFNPFHLTNLTHTLEISVSKHAESWRRVNEWKPAFDWMDKTTTAVNRVGDEEAFAVLCILTLTVLLFWLLAHLLKPQPTAKRGRKNQSPEIPVGSFEWPKIDLAILVISLLSLYMAIRSRRFIAIAGSAAAPIVFLMILQVWQMFSARLSWKKEEPLRSVMLPSIVQWIARGAIILLIIGYGTYWTMEYKRIYLDPWPINNQYHSVFMRMTASYLKPFDVCRFINDNNIKGHVFNYWTEGGAIAFGQSPDPETGQIPLKLFMDGRAQAAYNHDDFQRWQNIYAGGPNIRGTLQKRKKINKKILTKTGQWLDSELKDNEVWVVLMPQAEENKNFMKALKTTKNWKTAYLDNTQHLLVDSDTPQGQTLLNNIIQGTAVFPNVYSKNLTTANVITETQNSEHYKDLYRLIKGAFDEYPLPTVAITMGRLTRQPMFRDKAVNDLKVYLDDFIKNKDAYMKKHGSLLWIASAQVAAQTCAKFDTENKDLYKKYMVELKQEAKALGQNYSW